MSGIMTLLRRSAPLIGLLLFAAALWGLHHALRGYHYRDILQQLRLIPFGRVGSALLLTAASYLVMTAYDGLAVAYIRHPLERGKVVLASFISYAFSNTIGLSVLTSGSLRFRFYSAWDFSVGEVTRVVAFTTLTFWLGILTAGGLVFLLEPLAIPAWLHLPFDSARPLGLLFVLLVLGYLGLVALRRRPLRLWRWDLTLPSFPVALGQLVVGGLDWLLAGSVLYVLLPDQAGVGLGQLLGIFVLAQLAALISHVPGGVGVFESLVIFSLPGVGADALLGSLLVYRAIYYLLPLLLAALLLALTELSQRAAGVGRTARSVVRWGSTLVPHLLAAEVLVAGAVLLFSGAVPADPGRLHWLRDFMPLPMLEISHFLGSLAGAGLLLLALGIQRRLDVAYLLSAILLAAGSFFSLLKAVDYEQAILLLLMLAALLPCRRHFYRHASLFGARFSSGWVAAILLVLGCSVWLGIFAYKDVSYSQELWWHFALKGDAPRFLRATVGAMVLVLLFAGTKLLRPTAADPELPSAAELDRAAAIARDSGDATANLALLGDKYLLFNPAANAFIMYGIAGKSWVAMGDPIGGREEQVELAWSFFEQCEKHGVWPVFYEIGPAALHLYLDMGMTLVKIGEEARIDLGAFSLEGKERKGLRYTLGRLERDGCSFEVVAAEGVAALLPELRVISDAWLEEKHTREKGFSLGCFDDDYLCRNPLALVRREGEIVAFANLWPSAGEQELSIDLMRFCRDAPASVMEYLFISLMLWGQQQGYRWFNLGMAPLAGLENRPSAPLWNRIGALTFRHGAHFYNFQGLRDYKQKFDPVWEPRYLALPGGLALPRVLTNITTLISGSLKGALGK